MLSRLQTQFVYGWLPLVHALVFGVEVITVIWLIIKFNYYYNSKSLLTIMVTNAVLAGIADTVAQTMTSVSRTRAFHASGPPQLPLSREEIIELNEKTPAEIDVETVLGLDTDKPLAFDFERLVRFMAYGFIMSPVQYNWYAFLGKGFPLGQGFGTVIKRTCVDQLVFSPVSLVCFFLFMTLAEGGGKQQIHRKFDETYLKTLKANWTLWPVVQLINFQFVPPQVQIPFVSTIGIGWTAYLSLSNAK